MADMATNWFTMNTFQQQSQPFLAAESRQGFSDFFRRPRKIVKSNSRNQSPRNPHRRRMTAQLPMRTRSVVDPARNIRNSQWSQGQHHVRPTSWHPISLETANAQQLQHFQYHPSDLDQFSFQPDFTTANVYGLVTPINYPVYDDSSIQELSTPLNELAVQDGNMMYLPLQHSTEQASIVSKQMNFNFDGPLPIESTYQTHWTTHYAMPGQISTAPASPEFLAMPDIGAPFNYPVENLDVKKDELVGMGLYDSPAEVQTSSLLFGGWDGLGHRKSLKLQESFEPKPPSESDHEDDDGSEDAEAEFDDEVVDVSDTETIPSAGGPVMEDRIETYTDSIMAANVRDYLANQYSSVPMSHVGWV